MASNPGLSARGRYAARLTENYYMMTMNPTTKARFLLIGKFLLMLVFAISILQWPLYSSNQNTYFVHGLANAGVGHLNLDWLAQTTDPYPVFSALVSGTIRVFGENAFYFYQIVIQVIYAYSILGIGSYVFRFDNMRMKYLSYFVLLATLYSGLLARFLSEVPGLQRLASIVDPNGQLVWGVAGQYILSPYFQPSVFGIFIVVSIYAFLRDKPFVAIVCLAIAATFHSTYLLSAAVLTLTYMAVIVVKDNNYRKALLLGTTASVLVLPIFIYIYLNFSPTTTDIFAQAQSILVDYRIPNHAIVTSWFGKSTLFQIIVVVLSMFLVRRTVMLLVLLGPFLAAMILTVAQLLTGDKTLALLFPWRISVFLVPIASSIIFAGVISVTFRIFQEKRPRLKHQFVKRPTRLALFIGGITIVVLSLVSNFVGIGSQSGFSMKQILGIIVGFVLFSASLAGPRWHEIPRFLQQTRTVRLFQAAILGTILGTIIMLGYFGVRHIITLLDTPRVGVNASTKLTASTYQLGDLYLIPPDMESFRLAARIPIFVDFKSHPYKDTELVEWFNRVEIAKDFYASSGDAACSILQNMSDKYGITHVISETSIANCGMLHELYRDADVVIYEVQSRY